ncbi:hypothetical protein Moror_14534 [Moniliophthora roreri MCA 2997]|uniref:Extracellular membrane protein CFEM domain-containing protein n=1 Tax=Moniliophthora roreri (strain MCA 2997) TaxID=1381753 RepID=V2X2I7_MONRO|nr:hypothetical protein Moror_14534 [Moniliophthora roreri MCA 2997]
MFSKVLFFLLAQRVLSDPLPLISRQASTQRFNTSTPWGEVNSFSQCTFQCRNVTQGRFTSCNNDSNYFSCVCTQDVSNDYDHCLTCIANTQTWDPSVQARAQAYMNTFTETCRANGLHLYYNTINPSTVGSSNDSLDSNFRFNASTAWGEINNSNWPRCNDECKIVYDSSEDNGFAACNSSSNYFDCVCRDDTAGHYEDCLSCVANNVQSNGNVRFEAQSLMDGYTNACRARGRRVDYKIVQVRAGNITTSGDPDGNGSLAGSDNNGGTGSSSGSVQGNAGNGAVMHASISLPLLVLCGVASVLQI